MKKRNLFLASIGLLLFASCTSEIDVPVNPLDVKNQVKFNSTIGEMPAGTRATGSQWDQGDAIGVYALQDGRSLPDGIYNEKANVKYTTSGDGIFKPAGTDIIFPDDGSKLDFIAYYPFQETITDYKYPVDVSDQSKPAAIDLLYSNDAKGASKENTTVDMKFSHKLSQLVLNISKGDGVTSLEGLTVKIENLKTDGSMELANGAVTIGSTVTPVTAVVTAQEATSIGAAILVPGQDLSDAKLTFTLAGKIYEWTPEAQSLESGKKYTYPLRLSTTGLATLQPGATIEDWVDGYTGTEDIILTPDGETEDDYLSLADLRTMFTGAVVEITENVKVKAVVVQNLAGGNSTSKKNLVIQDETAGIAIRFIDDNETFTFGDEVEINLQGQTLEGYNGLLQINNLPNGNVTKLGTQTVTVKEITAAQLLSGNFESQYVAVGDVQVIAADMGKTFASATAHGTINMESGTGESFVMFTSRYAGFALETVPDGSGTLKGIAGISNGVYQILPTVTEDYAGMTNPRFGVTDILTVSPASIQFEATAGDTKEITVTASGAWTVSTEGSGFTVSPLTGTGDATVTATANAASGASGKITFALNGTTLTKEVAVSQKSSGGGDESNLLFPGSDFEDWNAFLGTLNSYGLSTNGYASQSTNGGRNNSSALQLQGTPTQNDYTFTATVSEGTSLAGKSKISFYVKGTSAKSLSMNVYVGTGNQMGTDYKCYNLANATASTTLTPTNANSYTGAINTNGEWIKVTLDISTLTVNSGAGQNLFALKVGSNSIYDLLIDDIAVE